MWQITPWRVSHWAQAEDWKFGKRWKEPPNLHIINSIINRTK
jgi:hypothetical protein